MRNALSDSTIRAEFRHRDALASARPLQGLGRAQICDAMGGDPMHQIQDMQRSNMQRYQ